MPLRWRPNSAGHLTCRGITPSQTVGPFFKYGLTPDGKYDWNDAFTNNLVTPDASASAFGSRAGCSTATAQPVPDAMLEIWQADAQGRFSDPQDERALPIPPSKASAAAAPMRTARMRSIPSSRARCRVPTASRRRRICCWRFSRAACCCSSIRGSISTARPPMQRPGAGAGAGGAPRDADRDAHSGAGNAVYRLRHPPAGRRRDGVFRRVIPPAIRHGSH